MASDTTVDTTARRPTTERLAAWRSFLTAHAEVVRLLESELAGEHDLPLAWYEVLLILKEAEHRRLRMHELADSLILSRSAVTRFIDRLEKAGLVCRIRCTEDRRGLWVELTDEGEATLRRAAPTHLRGIAEHFTDLLEDDELATLHDAMERVVQAARDQRLGE